MNISNSTSPLFASHVDLSVTKPDSPTTSDANFFSQSLDQDTQNVQNDGLVHQASGMFNQINKEKNHIDTSLRRAEKTTDPIAMNKAESQLSNYYLENMMNTKIVSKAVQSLDKITSLN